MSSAPTSTAPQGREPVDVVLTVPEMDCGGCAQRIQDRLRTVEGVADAAGQPVSRRLKVQYDPGVVTVDRIREEVGRLGYAAREDQPGRAPHEAPSIWRGPAALRTWVSGAFMAAALTARALGDGGFLIALPVEDLRLSGLLFITAAAVGGWNFFPKGIRSARAFSLDMNFLMTIAIFGAVGIGEYLEAGAIAFLFSLAELLERFSVDRVRRSIESLVDLSPDMATVLVDGEEVRRYVDDVVVGDEVVVRPGERIPVDGAVERGSSGVNQAPVTGESMPVDKVVGDEVFAGTVNGEGHLRVRVTRGATDTALARMIHLVEEAEGRRTKSERFVERFARWYTPAVTVAAIFVGFGPPLVLGSDFGEWFVRGLTLLVIACPCALVISTPVAVVSGITAAARNGVLIKGGLHLESMGDIRVVAFDKTGTLTRGHPEVVEIVPAPGGDADRASILAWAARLESRSEHPLARAIVRAHGEATTSSSVDVDASSVSAAVDASSVQGGAEASWNDGSFAADRGAADDFESLRGMGVRGRIGGEVWQIGRPELFAETGGLDEDIRRLREEGRTVVLVGPERGPVGLLALSDRPRPGAADAVARLRKAGVEHVVMLTGDDPRTAASIGRSVGIDEIRAGLMPEEKVRAVEELERRYGPVAMVGDGVNDGPALATASVGIAMGAAGSDTALETADIALLGDDLTKLAYLYTLSRRGRGVIRQNITAAIVLKGGLAIGVPLGWVSLIVAVIVGDMGASLAVTGNSLRLARVRP